MRVKKYLHSCVEVQDNGHKLLIDPGLFVFIEGKLSPEDIGSVDAVLITHTHPDHFYPEALKALYKINPFVLATSAETKFVMDQDSLGIPIQVLPENQVSTVANFSIETFSCPHEAIPVICPHNTGFKINEKLYHPGDSYHTPPDLGRVQTLLMPTGGPWATTLKSVEFAKALKPTNAIPIHDAMHKEFWSERLNASMTTWMKDLGVDYQTLSDGKYLEI